MKQTLLQFAVIITIVLFGFSVRAQDNSMKIEFPGIPGYQTLVCDFHMHTVFSDGSVWPDIRVQEANREGLDAISLTEHLEYQPYLADIPNPDRNRAYELARKYANGSHLIVINGQEITRSMPPGHANAIFINDANKLLDVDSLEVFEEASRQGAFVFWNHPNWTAQKKDGVAELMDFHKELIGKGLIHGIEVVNETTYSDEALQIALDNNLTIMGNSDIHGLTAWSFDIPDGGHRPVTLVFAGEKSEEAIKEALFDRRTTVWFNNNLIGKEEFLIPLIEASLIVEEAKYQGSSLVARVKIKNISDADFILQNESKYTFHENTDIINIKAHSEFYLYVKTIEKLQDFDLKFKVLNAVTAPGDHPEILLSIKAAE